MKIRQMFLNETLERVQSMSRKLKSDANVISQTRRTIFFSNLWFESTMRYVKLLAYDCFVVCFEVIKLEFILRLKIKRIDWLLADTCPQAANHCALFGV